MYTLIITGPIGAGKSTQYKLAMQSLGGGAVFVPEFLDDPDKESSQRASENLKLWIDRKMSLLDFQKYIRECQDRILSRVGNSGSMVRVMERLPSAASSLPRLL